MNPALAPVRNVESVAAIESPGMVAERDQTHIAVACPSPPSAGEREGPAPKAWEGEVASRRVGNIGATHLTPALSPRKRAERETSEPLSAE